MTEVGTENERRRGRVALAIVLLAVAATFAPVIRYGFVDWDDPAYVLENPLVTGASSSVSVADRLLTPTLGYPVPVTVATFSLEHAAFGLRPAVYHATNLLLHLGVCTLLFFLARRLGVGAGPAAIATLLFGIHPVVAEPVSWVTGRKDLLAALFALAATLEFLREPPLRGARRWSPLVFFLLGALSKPTTVFLAPFLFVCDLVLRRVRLRRALLDVSPFAAGGAIVIAVSLLGERSVRTLRAATGVGSTLREAWYALGFHLGLVFGVRTPCVKHFPPSFPPPFEPAIDLLPIAVLVIGIVAYRFVPAGPRRRALQVAFAWAGFAYLPSSNLLPLSRYLADSYVYLPLAGLALACGVVGQELARIKLRASLRRAGSLALGVSLVLLAVRARAASSHWKNDVTLWSQAYARYPGDYRVCRNLGNAYITDGRPGAALELYETCAVRTTREPFRKNIAIALFLLGRRDEARRAFLEIAPQNPEDPVILRYLRRLGVVVRP